MASLLNCGVITITYNNHFNYSQKYAIQRVFFSSVIFFLKKMLYSLLYFIAANKKQQTFNSLCHFAVPFPGTTFFIRNGPSKYFSSS